MCCIGTEKVVTVMLEEESELLSTGSKAQFENQCLAADS